MAFGKIKPPTWLSPEKKKKSPYVNKEQVKKLHGNRCKICGKSEDAVGGLEMAHYRARSKGGSLVFPLCPNCHSKYDKGLLNSRDLKKLNLSRKEYERYQPKKTRPKKKETFGFKRARFSF
jgi:hypothetical protein